MAPIPDEITDLVCVTCDYDLRGLDVASVCPECGTPIADSVPSPDAAVLPNPIAPAAASFVLAVAALLTVPLPPLPVLLALVGLCLGEQAHVEYREAGGGWLVVALGAVGRVLSAVVLTIFASILVLVAASSH